MINHVFSESEILARSTTQHKKWVKECVKKAAFIELLKIKNTHSKVADIQYSKFEIQKYLISTIFRCTFHIHHAINGPFVYILHFTSTP